MQNYYDILKVSPKATPKEIKSAFRRLARKLHPDVTGDTEHSAGEFASVVEAYEVLSSAEERKLYNKKLFNRNGSGNASGSVATSENPHARRMRQIALERRYNEIIDRLMEVERQESLALQQAIFPLVALFLSTVCVAAFRPLFFSNAQVIGKIVVLTLFVVGVLHLGKRLKAAFERYTYSGKDVHDSIFSRKEESRPYPRLTAIVFLSVGIALCIGAGFALGNYLEFFMSSMMPKLFSPTLQPELIFYPPIVVLLVDLMHSISAKLDY